MKCEPALLKSVPLFSLLDDDEASVLCGQVEVKTFAPRQRIYKAGEPGANAYVVVSGNVRISTVDEDQQDVVVDETGPGQFFGFASMLEQTSHHTTAVAVEESVCIEVSRDDIAALLQRKPMAGMDLLTTLGHQIHLTHDLVRLRAARNPNEVIDKQETFGERVADSVASFGGSWKFIISFTILLSIYAAINVMLDKKAWDPYPFILLNLFLSMLASFQAPVIMMSQNRQDTKDRVRSELDFEVNRRAESEIQGLARKLNLLDEKIEDVCSLLRDKNRPDAAR